MLASLTYILWVVIVPLITSSAQTPCRSVRIRVVGRLRPTADEPGESRVPAIASRPI
jgi:hypothetical protein